jgi:streptothricin acetyltransferase
VIDAGYPSDFSNYKIIMAFTIRELDESNLAHLNRCDGTFTVDSELIVHAENREISYTVEPVPSYTKRYPVEEIDYRTYIQNPDKAIYFAFLDGQLAGQIILRKNWNQNAYIEDLEVEVKFRRQDIGRRLIEKAIEWAKARELAGIMLETQNNNVAACHFYECCGFRLRGLDFDLYRGLPPYVDETALYWYLTF